MTLEEAQRRDRILRAYFDGKDWDDNDEYKLKREFVLNSRAEMPDFPFVVDDEWEVVPGKTNGGRGDLVFTDGRGAWAVVEVKFIDNGRTGATARTKRKNSRNKVVDQAITYAEALRGRLPSDATVQAYIVTNESDTRLRLVSRTDGQPSAAVDDDADPNS